MRKTEVSDYRAPIPPDKDKQCYECKYSRYNKDYNLIWCIIENLIVNPRGTCSKWEKYK